MESTKMTSQSKMHTVGSRVWLKDTEEGWIKGEVLKLHEDDAVIVKMENGDEKVFREEEIPLQNPGVRGVEDMVTLTYLNEPGVLWNLKVRYQQDDIYTYTGSILIAVNPFMAMPHLYGVHMMEQYKNVDQGELSPHAYAIADASYRQMRSNRKSQAILVSGESGAGKTETSKHIMQYLAWLGGEVDRSTLIMDQNIEQKVLESNPLLEAFGNAKTVRNDNSSRFGKFTEIQFDEGGRISGAAIRTYLLERSRVVNVSDPERNYHIFYQVCDGATAEERAAWRLRPAREFKFLSRSSCYDLNGVDNAVEYTKTRKAMDVVGIPKETQESVFRAVVAVLHLGNVQFEEVDDDEACVSKGEGEEALQNAAHLLGVPVDGLRKILTTRTRNTPDGPIVSPISMEAAVDTRDSLAKTLYSRTFDWLVECVNKSIGQDEDAYSLIGVLDIYGFEEFARNDFEQFCINFANEKLQQHFNQHVFKMEQAEYEREGIEWSYIEFIDNQDVLDIIEGTGQKTSRKLGILDLLDESCRFPRFTYKDFNQKLEGNDFIAKSSRYSKPKLSQTEFVLEHYAGQVKYDTVNFLEKNKDFVVLEHQELLSKSTEDFMKTLFPSDSGGQDSGQMKSSFKFSSVSSRFKKQLSELMESLHQMEPHYIRCIKPNKSSVPMEFDNSSVLQQLRCGGVLEAVRISCAGYPSKNTFEEFYDHFWMMALDASSDLDEKGLTEYIVHSYLGKNNDTQFGKTRVFLRSGKMAELEKKRMEIQNAAATTIQAYARGWLVQREYLKNVWAIVTIQSHVRAWLATQKLFELRRNMAALRIQTKYRAFAARKKYLMAVSAAVKIQFAYRSYVRKLKAYGEQKEASAVLLQSNWRMYVARTEYLAYINSVILAQSRWRAKVARRELNARKIASKESGKLMKDKEALQAKVAELETIVENVKNQRNELRQQLKDEKSKKSAIENEYAKKLQEAQDKAKLSATAAAAAAVQESSERERLRSEVRTLKSRHEDEMKGVLSKVTALEQEKKVLEEKLCSLQGQMDQNEAKSQKEIEDLRSQLEKAVAQRDKAREEAQFAAANLQPNGATAATPIAVDGHLVGARRSLGVRGFSELSPGREGATLSPGLSPSVQFQAEEEPVSDMDRRQRELHAKQVHLIREKRAADQESLIAALKVDLGFTDGKPIAAIVVFRCCVQWKAIQAERGNLFDRIIETIGEQVEMTQENNQKLGYWLTNTVGLFYLMQKHTKPASESGITARLRLSGQHAKGLLASAGKTWSNYFNKSPLRNAADASVHGGMIGVAKQFEAKYPALLFKQQSHALVQKIFPMLRDNVKKEITGYLNACIHAPKAGHGGRLQTGRKEKKQSEALHAPTDHSNITAPWRDMLKSFQSLLNVLRENHVPSLLASKLVEQLFHFVNVQLFNQLLLRRECCSFSNGEFVKLGLTEVEQWSEESGQEWVGNSWEQLSHIRQAVTFLVIHQKSKKTLKEIMNDLCPKLTVQQLYRISTMYWDDRYQTETVNHQVLIEMKQLMVEEGQRGLNHSFLLDDDTVIPFSGEDIGIVYDEIDLLEGLNPVPGPLQEKEGNFDFLMKQLEPAPQVQ